MSLILDAGRVDGLRAGKPDRTAFLERAYRQSEDVRTTTAVVAQTWHGGARQVRLAALLRGVDERDLTSDRARSVGQWLRRSETTDVVDGTIVDIAQDGDEILTGDPGDIRSLATAAGETLIITRVS